MMKNEMKTNNKTVLLAIVAVFAMIAAGAAVVMTSSDEVSADGTDYLVAGTGVIAATAQTETPASGSAYLVTSDVTMTAPDTADATITLYVVAGKTVTIKADDDKASTWTIYVTTSASTTEKVVYLADSDAPANTTPADSKLAVVLKANDVTGVKVKATYGAAGTSATAPGTSSSFQVEGTLGIANSKITLHDTTVDNTEVVDGTCTLSGAMVTKDVPGTALVNVAYAGYIFNGTIYTSYAAGQTDVVLDDEDVAVLYTGTWTIQQKNGENPKEFDGVVKINKLAGGTLDGTNMVTLTAGDGTAAAEAISIAFIDASATNINLSGTFQVYSGSAYGAVDVYKNITVSVAEGAKLVASAATTVDGTLDVTGEYTAAGLTTVNGAVNVYGKMTTKGDGITIAADARVNVYGIFDNTAGSIAGAGKIAFDKYCVPTSITYAGGFTGYVLANVDMNNAEEISSMETSKDVTNATVKADFDVPEDAILTLNKDTLLNGHTITVYGTIVLPSGSFVYDIVDAPGKIVLKEGAAIVTGGTLGTVKAVGIRATTLGATPVEQTLTFAGVSGVSIDTDADMVMTLSGELKADSNLLAAAASLTNAKIDDLVIGAKITLTLGSAVVVPEDSVLTINGGIAGAFPVTISKGAVVNVNGYANGPTFTAKTGEVVESVEPATTTTFAFGENVKGLSFTVDRVTVEKKTYQSLFVFGTLAKVSNEGPDTAAAKTVTIAGEGDVDAYIVSADTSITIPDGFTITGGDVIIAGTVAAVAGAVYTPATIMSGAAYAKTVTVNEVDVTTTYYVPMDVAYDAIATVDDKTIRIFDTEVDMDMIIADGQTLMLAADAVIPAGYGISALSGATVTLMGVNDFTVIGILDVKSGATVPVPKNYDVKIASDDEIIYAGIDGALELAEPGDTVTMVKETILRSNLTVPAGVTLQCNSNLDTATFNVTIEEDASLIMKSGTFLNSSEADNKKTITVDGLLDCSKATFTGVSTVKGEGIAMFKAAIDNYVGALYGTTTMYFMPLDAAALLAESPITVMGTVSYDEVIATQDIILANGAKLTVTDLSIAGIAANAKVDATNGELNGKVTVANDIENAVFNVTKFKGVLTYEYDAKGSISVLTAYTAGNVTVADGVAYIKSEIVPGANMALNIGSEALVIVSTGGSLTFNDGISANIAGTLAAQKEGAITVDSEKVVLTGTIAADYDSTSKKAGAVTIDDLNFVSGTLVAAEGAQIAIPFGIAIGTIPGSVGGAPTVIGKVAIGAGTCVVAYPGADVSKMTLGEGKEAVTTTLVLNGTTIATIIADKTDAPAIMDVILVLPLGEISGLDEAAVADLKDPDNYELWGLTSEFDAVGDVATASAKAAAAQVEVKMSWDTGMSLYVDNIRVTSTAADQNKLAVGTHTVMVKVNPGYKYADGTSATVTFNGKVLSGLMVFEITPDMEGTAPVLSATATLVVDQPDIPEQEKKDDSMIMILLGILVVMVVILAIVTVIRMMRS